MSNSMGYFVNTQQLNFNVPYISEQKTTSVIKLAKLLSLKHVVRNKDEVKESIDILSSFCNYQILTDQEDKQVLYNCNLV
jgi:hypothetical protein